MQINSSFLQRLIIGGIMLGTMVLSYMPTYAETVKTVVVLKILQVCHRVQKEHSDLNAVLQLSLTNISDQKITLCFAGLLGKGGDSLLSDIGMQPQKPHFVRSGTSASLGGSFSQVKYVWLTPSGKRILAGTYDLSLQQVTLADKGSISFCVPISVPQKKGTYVLKVSFDNSEVRLPHASLNAHDLTSRYVFQEMQAQSDITIK